MKIDAITIDGVEYEIVEGREEPPCLECEFHNNGYSEPMCHKLCSGLLTGRAYPKRKEVPNG